jgi:hypothetical protein
VNGFNFNSSGETTHNFYRVKLLKVKNIKRKSAECDQRAPKSPLKEFEAGTLRRLRKFKSSEGMVQFLTMKA